MFILHYTVQWLYGQTEIYFEYYNDIKSKSFERRSYNLRKINHFINIYENAGKKTETLYHTKIFSCGKKYDQVLSTIKHKVVTYVV